MSNPKRKPRQSLAQWQTIIDRQADSGLSAPQYCKKYDITYQSFMRWRHKLSSDIHSETSKDSLPAFVELTAGDSLQATSIPTAQWQIELDLAPGVQLRIVR